eukprot:9616910-Heterocapsa_arctica.AAC.1
MHRQQSAEGLDEDDSHPGVSCVLSGSPPQLPCLILWDYRRHPVLAGLMRLPGVVRLGAYRAALQLDVAE